MTVGLNTLTTANKRAKAPRGRGGKRGKTSGRGSKGQKARAGHSLRPEMRDIIKKIPKLRGHGKNRARTVNSSRTAWVPVNLSALNVFANGDTVNHMALVEKGIITLAKGRVPAVKILAKGDLKVKVTVEGCAVSAAAKEAIEKAGGTVSTK